MLKSEGWPLTDKGKGFSISSLRMKHIIFLMTLMKSIKLDNLIVSHPKEIFLAPFLHIYYYIDNLGKKLWLLHELLWIVM